ncbi:MAG: efflux RND transporter permease subunit [Armatimonadota bacterium]|nr:efflux RND transporter permease subunit [Armatimonadota bacterium]MDR7454199.1 efflux RND transporter permease subunit [Armatimonadota bacterium]MDR7455873.1 efflux RND transporter permease subunit [Armatimonadota bacterium]MDR7497813.1 efflux RND transporter permease subunit [Armatimonadota bacterium]MDR7512381.1 efflux RND transporter permease subunit [Armatimonadota bacterium]
MSALAVRRPVFVLMLISALMVLGLVSYVRLPVELFPNIQFPFVSVTVLYPGAGPDEVQQLIAEPLEEQLSSLPNVRQVRTLATEGQVFTGVEFALGTNVDAATADVRQRVDIAKVRFPRDAEEPIVAKFDFASEPVLNIGLSGARSPRELRRLADDIVKPRFERVAGVAAVNVSGGLVREIRVEVDQDRLRAYGLTVGQVEEALRAENVNIPGGRITERTREFLVRLAGQFTSLEEIAALRIARPGGALVRLDDVAVIRDLQRDPTQYTRLNGRDSVGLTVQKQAGANTVAIADGVRRAIAELQRTLPGDITFGIAQDQSLFIRSSVADVQGNLVLGAVLVAIVVFLFLHNVRSTAIIALSMPTAIVATAMPLYFSGFTINIMSLLGMAVAVGVLVDNAIVVTENINRHLELDPTPRDAAREGAREIELAVLASTLTNVAVFVPIAFTRGIVGQFFRQFGLTVVFANLLSVFIAFTLTPMLSSRWLRRREESRTRLGRFFDRWDVAYDRLAVRYQAVLAWCLRHRFATLGVATAAFVASLALVASPLIGKEFFPVSDAGEFRIRIEMPIGSSLAVADAAARQAEEALRRTPEVKTFFTQVGALSQGFGFQTPGSQIAEIAVSLVGKDQRRRSVFEIMEDLRGRLAGVPAAKVKISASSEAGGGQAPIQVEVSGPDPARLQALAAQVEAAVREVPGAINVDNTLAAGKPEIEVRLDRERAARFGLSSAVVGAAIRSAVEGSAVTRYRIGGDEYDITVRARPEDRASVDRLGEIAVGRAPDGTAIRLRDVATMTERRGAASVQRKNRVQFALISADLQDRPLGAVIADIQRRTDAMTLPPGFAIAFAGEAEFQAEAFRDMLISLALAILFVYMVMAAQFESLAHPFTILFTIPLAAVGVFPLLFLTRINVSIMSLLGIIMLTGIIVNNAIILVDYTNRLRARGLARTEALLEAGRTRLRPILMTSLTTILGGLPVALGIGTSGAEWRRPLGVAVLGGLATSTFLTLLVIPVVYTLVDGAVRRIFGGAAAESPRPAEVAPVAGAGNGEQDGRD